MARVVALGSAAAVPNEAHANTYLAVEGERGFFLIDCGDSPLVRIQRAGLAPERLRGLIITHFHPDHVFGIPILLMNIWLLGRTDPLPVYGLQDVLERFEVLMDLCYWQEWPDLFPVSYRPVIEEVGALVLEDEEFRITGAPVEHLVPTLGLRIENKRSGGVGGLLQRHLTLRCSGGPGAGCRRPDPRGGERDAGALQRGSGGGGCSPGWCRPSGADPLPACFPAVRPLA